MLWVLVLTNTVELPSRHLRELEESRRQLGRALDRVGDTLSSTHDLVALLDVVLETCALTLHADASVFYATPAPGIPIEARASYGADVTGVRLPDGGMPGQALTGNRVCVWPGARRPAFGEPPARAAMAVPMHSRGRLFGALVVYRRHRRQFSNGDVDTFTTLARQTETAIDNVFLHEEAQRLSITDGLTGVWNRRHFEMRAAEAIQVATRFGEPFAVVMVDIDHFKQVNDTYGHQVGDAVLVELAGRLSAATREVDLVARYGGEEFVLLLPRTALTGAAKLAEKVRSAVAAEPVRFDDRDLSVTVSCGVAAHPDHGATVRELVAASDAALYRAKAGGRNRAEIAAVEERVP